jgi:hypothetical protein
MSNSRLVFAAATMVLALLVGCEKPPSNAPVQQPEATGHTASITISRAVLPSILMEAESGKIDAPMEVFTDDADASGGAYILAPEGPNHEEKSIGGGATLKFEAQEPGEYTLWLRAKWCCDCANTVNIIVDGIEQGSVGDSTLEVWHWVPLTLKEDKSTVHKRINLSAGPHLLAILNREDGAQVDQVLWTQDDDYRPSGIELADVPKRATPVIIAEEGTTDAPAAAPNEEAGDEPAADEQPAPENPGQQ